MKKLKIQIDQNEQDLGPESKNENKTPCMASSAVSPSKSI